MRAIALELKHELIGLGGVVERNVYLTRRYIWWDLAFFVWTVANTLTIVFIAEGIEATGGSIDVDRATTTLLIGAVVWGFGLTMFGYLVSFIPPVADLVREYIDVILLIAVGGTALITAWHYFSERRKAKKAEEAGADVITDEHEAQELVLDPDVFERPPHLEGDRRHDGHGHGRDTGHGDDGPPAAS